MSDFAADVAKLLGRLSLCAVLLWWHNVLLGWHWGVNNTTCGVDTLTKPPVMVLFEEHFETWPLPCKNYSDSNPLLLQDESISSPFVKRSTQLEGKHLCSWRRTFLIVSKPVQCFFWYSNVSPNACHIQKLITAVIEPNYFKVKYSPSIKCDNVWISERVAVPCWEVSNCDLVKMKCVMNTVYTAVFLHYCSSQNIRGRIHGLSTNYNLTSETWLQIGTKWVLLSNNRV